jgi:hypothetical protein
VLSETGWSPTASSQAKELASTAAGYIKFSKQLEKYSREHPNPQELREASFGNVELASLEFLNRSYECFTVDCVEAAQALPAIRDRKRAYKIFDLLSTYTRLLQDSETWSIWIWIKFIVLSNYARIFASILAAACFVVFESKLTKRGALKAEGAAVGMLALLTIVSIFVAASFTFRWLCMFLRLPLWSQAIQVAFVGVVALWIASGLWHSINEQKRIYIQITVSIAGAVAALVSSYVSKFSISLPGTVFAAIVGIGTARSLLRKQRELKGRPSGRRSDSIDTSG